MTDRDSEQLRREIAQTLVEADGWEQPTSEHYAQATAVVDALPGYVRRLMDANQLLREQVDTLLWLHAEAVHLNQWHLKMGEIHQRWVDETTTERDAARAERDRAEASRQAWAEEAMRLDHAHEETVRRLREEIAWQKDAYRDGPDKVATGRTIGMEDALRTVEQTLSPSQCSVHPVHRAAPPFQHADGRACYGCQICFADVLDDDGDVSGVLPEGGTR